MIQFRDFEQHFKNHQLITTQDISNVFENLRRGQLSRWESKGWLTRVRQGQYLLSSKLDSVDKELLANEIKNSYISLEYALNRYNLIPEVPQKITSVTTERSETVDTPLGSFLYRKIKSPLFRGYTLKDSQVKDRKIKIALPTKALFDWVYLSIRGGKESFEEARLNLDELVEVFEVSSFQSWLEAVSSPAIEKRLKAFLSFLKDNANLKAD